MKTQRYYFSVAMPVNLRSNPTKEEFMHACVPDEGSEEAAFQRLIKDDPLWRENEVRRHGLVPWFEGIHFHLSPHDVIEAAA